MKEKILSFICLLGFLSLFVYLGSAVASHQIGFGRYQGTASWYSRYDPGVLKTTANMEIFNHDDLTCAMWGIPFGAKLRVTNLENDKSVVVRVNDRGPARRLVRQGRLIDLSKKAFSKIASLDEGLVEVEISVLSRP